MTSRLGPCHLGPFYRVPSSVHRSRGFLLGTALGLVFLLATVASPAFADGGAGVFAGGADSATSVGGDGGIGGGGGGAGVTGGAGGQADGQAGGAGGSTPGASGSDGLPAINDGTGGGGGAHGYVGVALPDTATTPAPKGGKGGNGSDAVSNSNFDGGGGGAGGYGAVVSGAGSLGTLGVNVSGGNGGTGGAGGEIGNGAHGGSGGSGGIGLLFTNVSGASLTIGSGVTVQGGSGGDGGTGGPGGSAGTNGNGGNGIQGAGLTIINAGTIAGGAAGSGGAAGTAGNAIDFTGGSNVLTTNGGMLTGNIAVTGSLDLNQTAAAGATGNASYGNIITGTGSLSVTTDADKSVTLTGTNTYTGATTINGGTLEVDGAITNSAVTVNSGGTLSGTGTVGDPTIASGGTLSPGSAANPYGTLTLTDALTFQSGSFYTVHISPSANSSTLVQSTATLGGATVNAIYASGSYVAKQYTILTATGGLGGTTFGSLVNTNLPSNFSASLSYDPNDVYLDLALNYGPSGFAVPGGLNRNQQAVGNALSNYFNTNGGIPLVYGSLTPTGLSQASGELGTGSQQTTFDAMGQFMGLLTDPYTHGAGGFVSAPGAAGYADEKGPAGASASRNNTDAFAMFTKAPPAPFVQRWSVWASGYGGSQSTDGNAAVGSNNTTSSVYGTAVGADYLFSPNTIAGFALAGGGTNFSVNGQGSGRSDLFQAGAYVRHTEGAAYITAALAYGWQDITTDRYVTAAGLDHLRAEFNANAYSGRLEGGYRFVAPWTGGIGLTPYAAAQFTTFDLPAYAEQVLSGTGAFALGYASQSVTDTRSELGLRTDKAFALSNGVLTLRGRLAWAHDFNPDRSIAATFQALPGASFVVNGAAQASDSALTTASIEMNWLNGWSASATFEGEFSNVTESYAGKGVVRYSW